MSEVGGTFGKSLVHGSLINHWEVVKESLINLEFPVESTIEIYSRSLWKFNDLMPESESYCDLKELIRVQPLKPKTESILLQCLGVCKVDEIVPTTVHN